VIVDKAAEAREEDEHHFLLVKRDRMARAKLKLEAICEEMDTDKTGTLTREEVACGMETNPVFAEILEAMDIHHDELSIVCDILDPNDDGIITYSEFVDQLHKMRTEESHTLLIMIRHHILDMQRSLSQHFKLLLDDRQHPEAKTAVDAHCAIDAFGGRSPTMTPCTQKIDPPSCCAMVQHLASSEHPVEGDFAPEISAKRSRDLDKEACCQRISPEEIQLDGAAAPFEILNSQGGDPYLDREASDANRISLHAFPGQQWLAGALA